MVAVIRHSFVVVLVLSAIILLVILVLPSTPSKTANFVSGKRKSSIWDVHRLVGWKSCEWWNNDPLLDLPEKTNGYIRVDCYGGLNQMRRDFCDGVGIARLLNATLVLPKFEVAAYWNETSGFADIFDVDYFIHLMKGHAEVVKEIPAYLESKEPVRVDCSKRKGQFDYVEYLLPFLRKHHFISITPAMSQRRDRYPAYAKSTFCRACFHALKLKKHLEDKGLQLMNTLPPSFLALHLRFEPDMVAYSQCEYDGLSPASMQAIDSVRGDRKPWTGNAAYIWRNRGKCPLTPRETAFILQSLGIPKDTPIYLAAGDGLLEVDGLTSTYPNTYTKSSLLDDDDFRSMHGNTKAALDYFISINSEAYVATYFGNMDKMVSAMRALNGKSKTIFLNRKAFAESTAKGINEDDILAQSLWNAHRDDFATGRGYALPDCFCEFSLQ